MKYSVYDCDICHKKELTKDKIYRIKVQSSKFINYVNQEDIFADRKTIDICEDCVNDFKRYLKAIRSPLLYGIN